MCSDGSAIVDVEVNIDEETLQKIAEQTGGQYFRADSQRKLREIYDKIDEMEKTEVEVERFFNYDEWFLLPRHRRLGAAAARTHSRQHRLAQAAIAVFLTEVTAV